MNSIELTNKMLLVSLAYFTMIVLVAVFYYFMIARPVNKEMKDKQSKDFTNDHRTW